MKLLHHVLVNSVSVVALTTVSALGFNEGLAPRLRGIEVNYEKAERYPTPEERYADGDDLVIREVEEVMHEAEDEAFDESDLVHLLVDELVDGDDTGGDEPQFHQGVPKYNRRLFSLADSSPTTDQIHTLPESPKPPVEVVTPPSTSPTFAQPKLRG